MLLRFSSSLIAACLISLIVLGVTAFAQDAAPVVLPLDTPATPSTGEQWSSMIMQSTAAALCAAITGLVAWLQTRLPKWLTANIDLRETMDAVEWERYVDSAVQKAFTFARLKTGTTAEKLESMRAKNNFLSYALRYLDDHHDDIVSFVDKNGNNILDVVETRLIGIAPDKLFPGEEAEDEAPRTTRRKTAPAEPDATLAKFAPSGRA